MSEIPLYDAFSVDYDRFVNWPARLGNELPFFRRLFRAHGVRWVLDTACGTGQHVLALAREGYAADGADLSPQMVARARENATQEELRATFEVAGLGEVAPVLPGPYDAVVCLGNSLPHLLSPEAVRGALADFAAILNPGGVLVIQSRNYDRVWPARERFMPLQSHREGDRERLFFRFMDFHEDTMTFNVVTMARDGGEWSYRVGATELRPIFRNQLATWLPAAGFQKVAFYGSYNGEAFDAQSSGDLIAVARKAR